MLFSLLQPFNILICVLQDTMDGRMGLACCRGEGDQNLCTRSKETQEITSKYHYGYQFVIWHKKDTSLIPSTCCSLINSTHTVFRTELLFFLFCLFRFNPPNEGHEGVAGVFSATSQKQKHILDSPGVHRENPSGHGDNHQENEPRIELKTLSLWGVWGNFCTIVLPCSPCLMNSVPPYC